MESWPAKAMWVILALVVASGAPAAAGPPCGCAQSSWGWLLFVDSNRRTPDFWWKDEVVVQEISICPHGTQFVFMAEEHGSPYLVALVFVNPQSTSRLRTRPDFPLLCTRYAALLAHVGPLLGALGAPADFRDMPWGDRPRILDPAHRLALVWQGIEVELRGYLDVYMTLLT